MHIHPSSIDRHEAHQPLQASSLSTMSTPAQVLRDVQFNKRLAEVKARVPASLFQKGSLAKRNQAKRKLYHDSELLRIELEERMNALGIEDQWLTASEMQEANAKLDAVRHQLKLDVLPASASPLLWIWSEASSLPTVCVGSWSIASVYWHSGFHRATGSKLFRAPTIWAHITGFERCFIRAGISILELRELFEQH